jgi:Uma2 family endonuclease
MSLAKKLGNKISEQEYLAGELVSDVKYEYIDGEVFAMAGASENHGLISGNLLSELRNNLKQKKSSCKVLSADMKVRIHSINTSFFYPDILVYCDHHKDDTKYYKHLPLILVEVLSKSTRKNDLNTKKFYYFNIPSLQEYVVIEQDFCEVEVFKKSDGWKSTVYFLGEEITFESIDATVSVEDIYYQVDNSDITHYLIEKAEGLEG